MTSISQAVESAQQRFSARNPESLEHYNQSCHFLPGGNTRTVIWHEPYPLRIVNGHDAVICDADGHEYVDFLGEYSAGLFGHNRAELLETSMETMQKGLSFGAHNLYEGEFARLLTERFEAIERVRFTNSGTEANLMAISTSREVTGRSKVVVFRGGYHGGVFYFGQHDSPLNAPFPFIVAPYNDLDATRALLYADADNIACVLVEPMQGSGGCIPATKEFLHGLRATCSEIGALLMFDEVMTSRLGAGGASGYYGVHPDLITLGKYLGGGHSFGAFGGSAELLSRFDPAKPDALIHAGTFQNNVLTMASGITVLSKVFTTEIADAHFTRGQMWRDRLNHLLQEQRLGFRVTGLGSLLNIHPTTNPISSIRDLQQVDDRLRLLLFLGLLERGIYLARRGFMSLSLALSNQDLDKFESALLEVASSLQPLMDSDE